MAIQLKRSATTGNAPSSLVAGEVAINEADALLFHRSPSGLVTPIGLREQLPRMNLAINGGMQVDQERAGASVTGITATSGYIADCTRFFCAGAVAVTLQQVTDAPTGFTNSAKVTVTTADATIASTDSAVLATFVEGYDAAKLGWGAAGAKPISVGFWAKANRTGTNYSGSVSNGANRSYPFTFGISAAGTWEYKTVTIPGDTTGTWDKTNGAGLVLNFAMAAGSNFTGTANTWAGSNYYGVTSTINGVAATTDYFQVTGVSIVEGNTAIPSDLSRYAHGRFEDVLLRCQRYYEKSYRYAEKVGTATTSSCELDNAYTSSAIRPYDITVPFRVLKRAPATLTVYSTVTGAAGYVRDDVNNGDVATNIYTAADERVFYVAFANPGTMGQINYHWVADARL